MRIGFLLVIYFTLMLTKGFGQGNSKEFKLSLQKPESFDGTEITWETLVIESVEPDSFPGEQYASLVFRIHSKTGVRTWRISLPSDYNKSMINNPEDFSFYNPGLKLKLLRAELESPKEKFILIRAEKYKPITQFSIDNKITSERSYDLFLKKLKQVENTWFCAETTEGGMTGYKAKDPNGVEYKVEIESNNKGQFNKIIRIELGF